VLALVFGCFVPGSLFLDPRFGHVVEREFRAFCSWILVFGRFLGVFDPRFWILKWSAATRPTVACISHEPRVVGPGILKLFRVGGPCGRLSIYF
jgi:hypothetical protein